MADKPLKSITFPGLADKYMIPEIDSTLTQQGEAADAKKTGDEISGLKNTLNHKADVIYDTVSGDIASFPDGADGSPVKDLTVAIEPVQDLHGQANPYPPGGGKNLLGPPYKSTAGTSGGITSVINSDGSVRFYGTATGDVYWNFKSSSDVPLTLPAGTYTISDAIAIPPYIGIYSAGTFLNNSNPSRTITLSEETSISAYMLIPQSAGAVDFTVKLQVETGSVATDWAPYSNICPISGWTECNLSHSGADTSDPTVIPISWQSEAGTVYGGTLDVTTGTLTVTHKYIEINGDSDIIDDAGWNTQGTSCFYISIVADRGKAIYNNEIPDIFSNMQTTCSYNELKATAELNKIGFTGGQEGNPRNYLEWSSPVSGLVNEKARLTTTPMQVAYPLETVKIYQLDSATLTTLFGENNIWADCGPSTVEYPCDTKLYIQKINAPSDDDMIADAQIASGKYFIVGNNLYLSTAAILAGDPIKPGTNCTLTNLAAALNAINT